MLMIARREGESLYISLDQSVDPSTPVGEVFTRPILVKIDELRSNQAALAIDAPELINIVREELLSKFSRNAL